MKYLLVFILIFFAGCSKKNIEVSEPPSTTVTTTTFPVIIPDIEYLPLSWENTTEPHPERSPWSKRVSMLIEENLSVLSQAIEIKEFCPRFNSLNKQRKIKALGEFVVALIFYESGYNPASRMKEIGAAAGVDSVTKAPVYSEGLMQLSYQDIVWAPYCEFDWAKDKLLAATSSQKSILNPYKNLSCGIRILSKQTEKKKSFFFYSGNYWAVLKTGGKYQQISGIKDRVRKKAFGCN